jgi:hypothetical protein
MSGSRQLTCFPPRDEISFHNDPTVCQNKLATRQTELNRAQNADLDAEIGLKRELLTNFGRPLQFANSRFDPLTRRSAALALKPRKR